ncbi:MAG: bifunctional N-acetylglucosamine-1-phosphate uridyltransferase/glucosamine-1-phosphate acetyltransferase, partial [bacterium]|nr:bifunctional N-acetylglucosamine-1-phosphate uridyltransferase/glucosamine-1-phosphate acetyltransferase [bacterium]
MGKTVSILILAAGLGTRMKSKRAKVLHRAGGRPLIEHVVRTALEVAEPANVTVVVGHQAEEAKATVASYGIQFALQTEQRGTGHAVMSARDNLAGRADLLVVLYGDGPLLAAETLRELVRRQSGAQSAATLITTELEDPTGYGRVVTDSAGRLAAIVEQKAANPEQLAIREINSGIYCFESDLLWKHLAEINTDNPAGEYYLTDMVEIFRGAGLHVNTYKMEDSAQLLGINHRGELAGVDRVFRERKVHQLMLSGVTIERPETVTIDDQVQI